MAVALVLRYLRRLRSSVVFISFMFAILKKKRAGSALVFFLQLHHIAPDFCCLLRRPIVARLMQQSELSNLQNRTPNLSITRSKTEVKATRRSEDVVRARAHHVVVVFGSAEDGELGYVIGGNG